MKRKRISVKNYFSNPNYWIQFVRDYGDEVFEIYSSFESNIGANYSYSQLCEDILNRLSRAKYITKGFIKRITRNICIDEHRKAKRIAKKQDQLEHNPFPQATDPLDKLISKELGEIIEQAINMVCESEKDQLLIFYRLEEQLQYKEFVHLLDMTADQARTKKRRLTKKLHECLEKLAPEHLNHLMKNRVASSEAKEQDSL